MDIPPRKKRRGYLFLLVAVIAATSLWWGKLLLSRFAFFRIREVEVTGTYFLDPATVVSRMRVDTLHSVWDDLDGYRVRIESDRQVTQATIVRKLPSTLVVRIQENLPVALIPTATGFQAFDSVGRLLAIDPRVRAPDIPIIPQIDLEVLLLLGRIRTYSPQVFKRISEISRPSPGELLLLLATTAGKTTSAVPDSSALDSVVIQSSVLRVRVPLGVTVTRLADIFPVENDLIRRQLKVAELDLRYRDQVIARLQ